VWISCRANFFAEYAAKFIFSGVVFFLENMDKSANIFFSVVVQSEHPGVLWRGHGWREKTCYARTGERQKPGYSITFTPVFLYGNERKLMDILHGIKKGALPVVH
jgi:hypothetical protein